MARRARRGQGGGMDDHYRQVADRLIAAIERGTAPWTQAWEPGTRKLPVNVSTGKPYRGMNSVDLASVADQRGYSDHRWGTFKQVLALGGAVRKGERGAKIVYWRFEDRKAVLDARGEPKRDKEGKPVYRLEPLRTPQAFHYTVFNADQCDGLPAREPLAAAQWDPIAAAEKVLADSGARIEHTADSRAFFDLERDRIGLPFKEQFASAPTYYQSALHELGHWTGHPSRLNRATLIEGTRDGYGSKPYAREELRAEISSMITGDRLQLGHDPARHASYVGAWIQALRDDPREIYRASKDAQGISDYVLDRERFRESARVTGKARATRVETPKRRRTVVALPGQPVPAAGGQLSMFQRAAAGGLSELAAREAGRESPALGR